MIDLTDEIDKYLKILFPINRSLTGNGNRETLKIISEIIPVSIIEYPSGEEVYDWIIPQEWNVKEAWIKDSYGNIVVNIAKSNLHVMGYSQPIHKEFDLQELESHLHYLECSPDAIPYRTSYYKKDWGFCLSYNDYCKYFKNASGKFEIKIDSSFSDGSMTLGELIIKGKSSKEYLISTYICHPSLANDNLSGVILSAFLARELLKKELNFTYRFVFLPETIGAIAYCAMNEMEMKNIDAGLVVTTVGGPGKIGYKQSYNKDHYINRIIELVLDERGNAEYTIYPFDIRGSDERQYSSQGFKINTATICKDKYYEYDYYHTSLDNLDFVKAEYINETLKIYLDVIDKLDTNLIFKNKYPNCEVMLSKHGLYDKIGGASVFKDERKTISDTDIILWLLFYADGYISLFDISNKINVSIDKLYNISLILEKSDLFERIKI